MLCIPHQAERMPTRKLHRPCIYVLWTATCRRTLDPALLRGHWDLGERRESPTGGGFHKSQNEAFGGISVKKTFPVLRPDADFCCRMSIESNVDATVAIYVLHALWGRTMEMADFGIPAVGKRRFAPKNERHLGPGR